MATTTAETPTVGETQVKRESGVESTQPVTPSASPATPAEAAEANEAAIKKLNKIITSCGTCMLTTAGEQGLHARPMAVAGLDFDTTTGECIYFVTDKSTMKVKEIESGADVALVFSNNQANQWATVTAHATVVEDLKKTTELWNPMYNAWFPKGPETPGVVLIKAVPTTGSYWEGSPLNKLHIIFSALKARVTGAPIEQRKTQDSQTVVFPGTHATTAAGAAPAAPVTAGDVPQGTAAPAPTAPAQEASPTDELAEKLAAAGGVAP